MNKINKRLFLAVIITTIVVTTLTFSKYKTTVASKDKARVAAPVVSLTSNFLNLGVEINPDKEITNYIFEVSNYDEQKKSEVSMEYTLQIKTSNSLPLEFELYDCNDENEINLLNGNSTNKILMNVNQTVNNQYCLKIKWNENKKNYLYSEEVDYIQLILNCEQID